MKRKSRGLVCVLLLVSLCVSLLAGCGGKQVYSKATTMGHENPGSAPTPTPISPLMMLTEKQRNSINMLNYLTVLVQEIYESKNSRLYLESAYSELINNTEPSIVDDLTLDEYDKILNVIEKYRLAASHRERLQYIYEQNNAHALRSAIPNPLAVLNVFASGDPLKSIASLVYMAVDSANSYSAFKDQQELQFLQDSWALDDEEANNLHNSRSSMFEYMVRVARDLPAEARGVTLSEEAVQNFVSWKNNPNVISRIRWLESNQKTYQFFGDYWLELADSYYSQDNYERCLYAISRYEELDNSIFRYDGRFAQTLPYAIISAQETMTGDELEETVARFASLIIENTKHEEWSLRYFAAQSYMNLYAITSDKTYLQKAYDIALDNVNVLVSKQYDLNETYLADLVEMTADKNATKEEKDSAKAYNKLMNEQRGTELPPVYEPLLLNCELLFALADKLNISDKEKEEIDTILHPNNEEWLFLNSPLDERFTFSAEISFPNPEEWFVEYDNFTRLHTFYAPALLITDNTAIKIEGTAAGRPYVLDDWKVVEVDRNKSNDISDFVVKLECNTDYDVKAVVGDTATVTVTIPGTEGSESIYTYHLVAQKGQFVVKWIEFVPVD